MDSLSFFRVRTMASDDRGAAMVEYSLIAACIAVLAIGGVTFLGTETKKTFYYAGNKMNTAGAINPPPEDEEVPW